MSEPSPAQKSKTLMSACVFHSSLFFPSAFAQRKHPRIGLMSWRISRTNLGGLPGIANQWQSTMPST